ncbi:hypothetical protein HG536_0G03310 [Torulaspora globosa]|uniref:SET domain-containing protein n=1 Tax=Torulaspora globosa TaxID=48254 RepID=A0A7G3ZLT3_9SACH|nr:uncharacterized protein HG536_0G03310 [Torulaspora globosa]QLL34469.1 hypothetical protein HG536_0G03310 [Torulaspora globosa]
MNLVELPPIVLSLMSNTLCDDLSGVLQFVRDCRDSFWSPECEIRESPVGGVGVFAGTDIRKGSTLLKLPKSSLFSASNSTIANLLLDDEIDGILALNIAFIYETTVFREKSHWVPYLKSIRICDEQQQLVLPPGYWSDEAKRCLRGSTLDTLHDGLRSETEVQEGFELAVDLARKWNQEFGLPIPQGYLDVRPDDRDDTILKFHRFVATAYAMSSRVFEIDAYHGSALVPIADLFNHSTTAPDVRFTSLYEVCPLCGEPGMCKHLVAEAALEAQENGGSSPPGSDAESSDEEHDPSNEDELVDITLERDVKKGQEIFNSYGELSNALLLARYGFTVRNNPHDMVHLGNEVRALVRTHGRYAARTQWWSRTGWKAYSRWSAAEVQTPWLSEIFVDSRGQPSDPLAAFLNLLEMPETQWLQLRSAPTPSNAPVHQLQDMGDVGTRAHLLRLLAYKKLSWRPSPGGVPPAARVILHSERTILRRARSRMYRRNSSRYTD